MNAANQTLSGSSSQPASDHLGASRLDSVTWRRRVIFVACLASIGCAADLWTKHWVFDWLGTPPEHRVYWLWENYVGLETSINTGALFGFGAGHVAILAVISVLATIGIIFWVVTGGAVADRAITLAVGMILGGVWGNLYDRLGFWGIQGVRDWILLRYGDFVWPNFNIADSLLVCGSALLVLHALRGPAATNA